MASWLDQYAAQFKERILRNKASSRRVAMMTGLPPEHATALARYVRLGELPSKSLRDPAEVTSETPIVAPAQEFMLDKPYVYNEKDDTYITFLPGVPKPLVLPGQVHREILRAYSNFDGSPASINEIARTVKLPKPWIVKYLRVHEITHDREPFTPEEILAQTDEELIVDAMQQRRATVYKKLEKAKWREIQEDALKWRDYEDHTLRSIQSALVNRKAPPVAKVDMGKAPEPYAVVVGLTDFHWGKYSDKHENFEGYDRKTARARLMQTTAEGLARLSLFGRPEKLIVPIGSDFLHIDTDKGETTRGTAQDMDGTPAEILVTACALLEEWLQILRQVAPVELVLMSGNHDRMSGLALLLYLDALYRSAPDVTVHRMRTPRVYQRYGKNLIGFIHGDGVSKTHELAGHMARENAQDWALCPHRTVYKGHLHFEKTETDTVFSVTVRQIPSLSGPDRWHSRQGFQGSPQSLPLYLHGKESGLIAILYGPVVE